MQIVAWIGMMCIMLMNVLYEALGPQEGPMMPMEAKERDEDTKRNRR